MPLVEIPLSILNIILVIKKYGWNSLGDYFKDSCINKDVYGAREYRTALNTLFKGKTGKGFGWSGLTISYELGYMVREDIYSNLNMNGWILEELLNLIDKNNQIYPSYFNVSSLINCDKIIVSGITTILQDYTYRIPINNLKKTENASIVQNVYDYILNNLEEPLPSIKELAKKFGTNDFKLKEDFRIKFNTSIYKFYTDERLKRATYLIQKTEIPIKEIAFICGFNDYNNFSKAFKKKYNYPPSALKRDI